MVYAHPHALYSLSYLIDDLDPPGKDGYQPNIKSDGGERIGIPACNLRKVRYRHKDGCQKHGN